MIHTTPRTPATDALLDECISQYAPKGRPPRKKAVAVISRRAGAHLITKAALKRVLLQAAKAGPSQNSLTLVGAAGSITYDVGDSLSSVADMVDLTL